MSNLFDSFLNTSLNKDCSKESSKVSNVEKSSKDEVKSGADPFLASFSSWPPDEKCADSDGRGEEKIPELDTLKTFTIPKKKKAKKELLEPISLTSREFMQEIYPVICKSYKDRNSSRSFQYTKALLVHNGNLLQTFQERRKEMRNEGYSEKDVTDCYGFLYVSSDSEVKRLCQEGAKVGNLQTSCLGNPEMAVCLCRHADILRPDGMVRGSRGSIVIFKYLRGKVKSLMENRGAFQIDPTPNFDCHVSKSANVDVTQASPQQSFESTQIYLYQYEDCDIVEKPKQICPYAVVYFKYVGETRVNKPPPLKPLAKSSVGSSRMMGHRSSAPPLQQMPPSPLSAMMKSPLPSPVSPASSGSVKSGPNTPQSGPHSVPSPLLPKPQSPANMQMPHHSGSGQLHRSLSSPGLKQVPSLPRSGSWSGNQQIRLPTSPAMSPLGEHSKMMSPLMQPPVSSPSPTLLQQQSKAFSNQASPASASSSSHHLPSPSQQSPAGLMQRSSVPSSPIGVIQQSPSSSIAASDPCGGVTVWSGLLTNKDKTVCRVELVSFGKALRPCRLGTKLLMTGKVLQSELKRKYFADSSHLALDKEVMLNGNYVTYCQLRPAKEDAAQFSQFSSFLVQGDYAASVILEEKQLFLMSNCELTCQLGLSYETDPILHCLFISSTSRELNIQAVKGDLNQNVDQAANAGIEETKLDDSFKKFVPVESLIYKETLLKAFKEQTLVQDKVNPDEMKSLSLQFSQQAFMPSVTAVDNSILRKLMQPRAETGGKQSHLSAPGHAPYGTTGDLNIQSQVQQPQHQLPSSHMGMGMDMAGQPNALSMYQQHGHSMPTSSSNMQGFSMPVSSASLGPAFAGMSHGYMPPSSTMMTNQTSLVPPLTHPGPLLPTPMSTNLGVGRPMHDPRKRPPLLGHGNMMGGPPPLLGHPPGMVGMNQLPPVSSAPNLPPGMGYMTSQSFDSQMQLPSFESMPGLDSAYLSHPAPNDSAASLHPQTRDPRLAQHQNQNLSKSLSVGATPMKSGAPLTPGITTTSSLLSSTTTRGTKPRPAEGRTADSETTAASQPSMRGLACDTATRFPTPSSSVPTPPLLSQSVHVTSSNQINNPTPLRDLNLPQPLPSKSVPVYIPTPKHALPLRSAVTQETEDTDTFAIEEEDSDMDLSDTSPPESPTHFGTGLLPAAITGNPELTDDLVDVIVKGPLLKSNRQVKAMKDTADGKVAKLSETGNDENTKHKARRTGPPLEKKSDDCQNKTTVGQGSLTQSHNIVPYRKDSVSGSSPSRHSLTAESIATLEADSVVLEITKPNEVPMKRKEKRRKRHCYKKWYKKYLKSEFGSSDADKKKAQIFSQSAISAGPEPDDLQVTFSWDTEPDWDSSLQLQDHDLIEDCVITVLARHMRESHPEKNFDEPESEEQQLLTDFWFHFIHYLEPCLSKDNAENIPPGDQNKLEGKEVKMLCEKAGLSVSYNLNVALCPTDNCVLSVLDLPCVSSQPSESACVCEQGKNSDLCQVCLKTKGPVTAESLSSGEKQKEASVPSQEVVEVTQSIEGDKNSEETVKLQEKRNGAIVRESSSDTRVPTVLDSTVKKQVDKKIKGPSTAETKPDVHRHYLVALAEVDIPDDVTDDGVVLLGSSFETLDSVDSLPSSGHSTADDKQIAKSEIEGGTDKQGDTKAETVSASQSAAKSGVSQLKAKGVSQEKTPQHMSSAGKEVGLAENGACSPKAAFFTNIVTVDVKEEEAESAGSEQAAAFHTGIVRKRLPEDDLPDDVPDDVALCELSADLGSDDSNLSEKCEIPFIGESAKNDKKETEKKVEEKKVEEKKMEDRRTEDRRTITIKPLSGKSINHWEELINFKTPGVQTTSQCWGSESRVLEETASTEQDASTGTSQTKKNVRDRLGPSVNHIPVERRFIKIEPKTSQQREKTATVTSSSDSVASANSFNVSDKLKDSKSKEVAKSYSKGNNSQVPSLPERKIVIVKKSDSSDKGSSKTDIQKDQNKSDGKVDHRSEGNKRDIKKSERTWQEIKADKQKQGSSQSSNHVKDVKSDVAKPKTDRNNKSLDAGSQGKHKRADSKNSMDNKNSSDSKNSAESAGPSAGASASRASSEKRRLDGSAKVDDNKRRKCDKDDPKKDKGNNLSGRVGKEVSACGPLRDSGQRGQRHHPYRRSQVHYKTYFTPRDPDQLLRLLTVSNYRQRHLSRRDSQENRFTNVRFMRNSTGEKYADEVDEEYNLDDIKNLGERKDFAEKLDKTINDHRDPVTELESAWIIEKQAYQNEADQVEKLFQKWGCLVPPDVTATISVLHCLMT